MNVVSGLIEGVRNKVRFVMRQVAGITHQASRGRVTPDSITVVGLLAHLPIAYLIATQHLYWAAGLLIVFGLFDTLDGELARLQQTASSAGMLLDAATDRFKEVLLYTGVAYNLASSIHPRQAVWAVVACGASLCVSYVKAKGETAIKNSHFTANEINRLFQDGLLRFEVRMFVLVVGLVFNRLVGAVIFIGLFASLTAVQRLLVIRKKLRVQG